jgi:hypothetical protein
MERGMEATVQILCATLPRTGRTFNRDGRDIDSQAEVSAATKTLANSHHGSIRAWSSGRRRDQL